MFVTYKCSCGKFAHHFAGKRGANNDSESKSGSESDSEEEEGCQTFIVHSDSARVQEMCKFPMCCPLSIAEKAGFMGMIQSMIKKLMSLFQGGGLSALFGGKKDEAKKGDGGSDSESGSKEDQGSKGKQSKKSNKKT